MLRFLNLRQMTIALAIFSSVTLMSERSRAETKLQWKFKQGQILDYALIQNMKISIKAGGRNINSDLKQWIDMEWTIDNVENNVATISQKITRIRMKLNSPGGLTLDYDTSSDREAEGLARKVDPLFKAVVKSTMTIKMNTLGEIVKVKISDELVNALKKSPGTAQLAQAFSEQGLEQMAKQMVLSFPSQAIEIGHSWKRSLEVPNPALGNQKITTDYTYKGVDNIEGKELEKIGVKLNIEFGKDLPGGGTLTIKNQKSEGDMVFDNTLGRLVSSTLKQSLQIEAKISGQTIQQSLEMDIQVKVTPGKKPEELDKKSSDAEKPKDKDADK